jgi:hypothetical protein
MVSCIGTPDDIGGLLVQMDFHELQNSVPGDPKPDGLTAARNPLLLTMRETPKPIVILA